ncbi:MAG: hypothetical protein SGI91_00655 [Alphaproteobacteria bacterium]|jgi:hypothetical protein|nr:hypothetical protein [Alphaproteobacteria bacterium]
MDKYYRNLFIGAALAAIVVIVVAFVFINRPRTAGPMASAERAQELARDGKREQVITFGDDMFPLPERAAGETEPPPHLFAIPIGQITLAEPQAFTTSQSSGRAYDYGYRGFRQIPGSDGALTVTGRFNNIVIYDKTDGSLKKIFDQRIAISVFKLMNRTTRRALVLTATSEDSDRDGAVDNRDIQQLYVYTFDDGQLHEVTGLEGSAGTAVDIHDVDYLIVSTTLDSDADGSAAERVYSGGAGPEPQRLYRVDLRTFAATPVLDKKLVDELQATLDSIRQAAPKPN